MVLVFVLRPDCRIILNAFEKFRNILIAVNPLRRSVLVWKLLGRP